MHCLLLSSHCRQGTKSISRFYRVLPRQVLATM
ncbi:hypothetical protein E2C01_064171 [Portunus trituberculatus]|uniref:Uncharacterized protein n=1 Tax=Portunus trituberculatus TaxID=210409 RepID=A0A5B7HMJ5_PORTR|nr:hypothetical protein [Portunus trituberculatus]